MTSPPSQLAATEVDEPHHLAERRVVAPNVVDGGGQVEAAAEVDVDAVVVAPVVMAAVQQTLLLPVGPDERALLDVHQVGQDAGEGVRGAGRQAGPAAGVVAAVRLQPEAEEGRAATRHHHAVGERRGQLATERDVIVT